jgi:hypothetical protein
MGRPKSTLKGLLEWRAKGREIHAAMMAMLGVGFPESQLITVVDGLLQVGGEGQAKAWSLAKPAKAKKYEVKTKPKGKKGYGGIVNAIRKSLDGTPRPSKEVLERGRKFLPNLQPDQVSKALVSMHLHGKIKRKGDTKPYQYHL